MCPIRMGNCCGVDAGEDSSITSLLVTDPLWHRLLCHMGQGASPDPQNAFYIEWDNFHTSDRTDTNEIASIHSPHSLSTAHLVVEGYAPFTLDWTPVGRGLFDTWEFSTLPPGVLVRSLVPLSETARSSCFLSRNTVTQRAHREAAIIEVLRINQSVRPLSCFNENWYTNWTCDSVVVLKHTADATIAPHHMLDITISDYRRCACTDK